MDLANQQRQFLAYLRNPSGQPVPAGFSAKRINIYIDLLYSKFNDSLSLCFPVTLMLLGADVWRQLVLDFIAEHRCLSPYYYQIPAEFVQYLQHERTVNSDPPFLAALAHFEWVELALTVAEAEPITLKPPAAPDWLNQLPVFVPVLEILHYQYPVHTLSTAQLPQALPAQSTTILGFRRLDDNVQFIELQPATARLITLLLNPATRLPTAITQIANELQHPEPETLIDFGIATLHYLWEAGAILGTQPAMEY